MFSLRTIIMVTIVMVMAGGWGLPGVWADDVVLYSDQGEDANKIHITANSLVTDNQAQYAEFSGDVVVTQGTASISGDKLRVYYQQGAAKSGAEQPGGGMIEKIIVDGNVKIHMGDREAEADHAEYVMATGIITLSGQNAKIVEGNNHIVGNKITINRKTDQMTVENQGQSRVEAVLYSEGQLID